MSANGRVILALMLALVGRGVAVADLVAKPDAYTEKDRLREKVEYNRKTLVDAYKEVGKKNPAWDGEAIKFLDAAARHFGSASFGALHAEKSPTRAELVEMGKAVAQSGCDDPLVLYCYGAFLIDSDLMDEGRPVLAQAYKGMLGSKYPAERIFYAANRMLKVTENVSERLAVAAELDKARANLLTIKFINSAHRRAILANLWEEFPETPANKRLAFYEEMSKKKEADQWIVNVFGGRHFIRAAWDARGGGWAAEVKDKGWRGFEANLDRARECLTMAWKIAPNLPEAPSDMITVTMGQGNRGKETLRTWFDRAVEAQFDHIDAYNKLFHALMPRWHGSHEEMLALGIECFQTGRYDTSVPYQLVYSLQRIRDDRGGDMSLWDKPEMYEMIKEVMVKYAEKFKGKSEESYWWHLSYAAALANRNGKHEDARKFLEELGDNVVEDRYREMRQLPKISVSESYLLTGPFAKRFAEAIELQKAEKHEEAAELTRKIIEEMPKDDKGLLNAKYHLEVSEKALKLASGEWVDLSPGVDRVPWGSGMGEWSSPKEGELLGVADARGLMTIGMPVPTRYEFSAKIEIKKMQEIAQPCAGLVLNFAGWQQPHGGVWVYPSDKKLLTRGKEDEWHDVKVGNTFALAVQVWDDEGTVMLDGKKVARFNGLAKAGGRRMGIGLGGMYETPGGVVVFSELKVRRLKEEPGKR